MRVLIADDDAVQIVLLERTLTRWGYEVTVCRDGASAYEALAAPDGPRLAILDWIMPGLSGLDVCRKLHEDASRPFTYLMLLTSKTQKEDLVRGLEAGAHDFVTKPFEPSELRSRVSVGARIIEYEAALAEKNAQLARYATQMEELAEARAKQLVHADRMATLGTMAAGIAHEINNPASFISGNAQTVARFWGPIESLLQSDAARAHPDAERFAFIREEMPQALASIRNGVKRIARIVKGLKVFARQDVGERGPCDLNHCVAQALELCHNRLKRTVAVEQTLDASIPSIQADAQQIEQVLVNLFVNAADAMDAHGGGTLHVSTAAEDGALAVRVTDTGPGIPADKLADIWAPFYTTKELGRGTGLGLSISKEIIEGHGGTITAENRPEGGALFCIRLPAAGSEKE